MVTIDEALEKARAADLDLVEVAAEASPPVCRLLDYSKYKYEQAQKAKAARKHQQQINVREIKLRPKIADHDYETKKGHVERFLRHQDKVKVTIMFRGRENAHPERGRVLLKRLSDDLGELAVIEQEPEQEGRNMHMLLAPGKDGTPPARLRSPRRLETAPPGDSPPSASIVDSHAEDEDTLGSQEAVPQDGDGQAARPARLLEPHPGEEEAGS